MTDTLNHSTSHQEHTEPDLYDADFSNQTREDPNDRYNYYPTTPDLNTPRNIGMTSNGSNLLTAQLINLDSSSENVNDSDAVLTEELVDDHSRHPHGVISESWNESRYSEFTEASGVSQSLGTSGFSPSIERSDFSPFGTVRGEYVSSHKYDTSEAEGDFTARRIEETETEVMFDSCSLVKDEMLFTKVQTESDVVCSADMSKSDVMVEDLLSLSEADFSRDSIHSCHQVSRVETSQAINGSVTSVTTVSETETSEDGGREGDENRYWYENVAVTDEEMMKNEDKVRSMYEKSREVVEDQNSSSSMMTETSQRVIDSNNKENCEEKPMLSEDKKSTPTKSAVKITDTKTTVVEKTRSETKTETVTKRTQRSNHSRPKSQPIFKSSEIPRPKKVENLKTHLSASLFKKVNGHGKASSDSSIENKGTSTKGDTKSGISSGASTPATPPSGKATRSRVGSLDNAKHVPGGGKIKIMSKKETYTTVESKVGSKTSHKPGGGNVKIESKSVDFTATKSRIGSLENTTHTPQGGAVKIEKKKLDFTSNAQSKVGSKDNLQHTPGGGNRRIESHKIDYSNMTKSKIGSMDNSGHMAGGGKNKVVSHKVDYSKIQSKCGSKDNTNHIAGGGNNKIETKDADYTKVESMCGSKDNENHMAEGGTNKIETHKLDYSNAQSKVGSNDNSQHVAGGGNKPIEDYKVE